MKSTTLFIAASLAAVLAVSMIVAPAALAATNATRDPRGDISESTPSSTFDISAFGIDHNGNPYVKLYGKAGSVAPEGDTPLIYAFVFFTDDGIYAVASHVGIGSDSDEGNGSTDYHAHKVTIDENHCLTSIDDEGTAKLQGNRIILQDTAATELTAVHAVQLEVTGTSGLGVCATAVFDIAESD